MANNGEVVALDAFDLLPFAAAPAAIRAVPVFSDDAFMSAFRRGRRVTAEACRNRPAQLIEHDALAIQCLVESGRRRAAAAMAGKRSVQS
ncbi:hypothetical protein FHT70_003279 [Rhizobium sp. BK049]|nr:hypothetical protein [Rhizobium sp. BK049]